MKIQAQSRYNNLQVSIESDVPERIFIDENRYKQVLLNLLSNSIKFCSYGLIEVHLSILYSMRTEKLLQT